MSRFGNALRKPNKAIAQVDAGVQLDLMLVSIEDHVLARHDAYSLGRMFRLPLKTITAKLDAERARRAGGFAL
ncbi:hypothetical protein [Sphingomonas sp.]|uniref:hypothetical protein n=1 Tax=Sphingomonas sp. TaxID=28214 RepID=UPI000DBC26D9|nr:hypothetical protein [Sphingomonas sp.]PZT91972.1 MAG: hypothetical protein DI625_14660 [Sphingomonas sp.]